ncbi:MAG: acyl-CoA dehydrogenase C-terminal domain-containing protein [Hyphomicrobiales bacterium]|nr:acyl-CoA dehydrogenase C-terminal domain-containing protein [Hyphomicrobiales bacterium]
MAYRAPVDDMMFTMRQVAGLEEGIAAGHYADLADGAAEALLSEAAKFAENRLAPINRNGDQHGAKLADGHVTTSPGWREAYGQWIEGGWNAVTASPDHGGMGLPHLINAACTEMWNSANMAFALCPLLGFGAVDAVEAHASDALKKIYLDKMVSGEWTSTMNLTEPSAGSDLNALRTRAERHPDGSYRIFGSKIFITYGEHDMTDNIVHLVLARLPDAPAGTRGISLFLVPKFLVNADGSLGARNDVHCAGVEHKLGIHGSPTCTMVYGDKGGAIGWLVGQENKGLACMFTMMNSARLSVGLQGVALSERATQHALAYARERKQGRAPDSTTQGMDPIVHHPDVKRMLLTMRAMTDASRAICYATAGALDRSHRLTDAAAKKAAAERNALLTPVAKAFSTDIGNEVTSIGVQVHGGMGFVEETGAAQFMRDARIAGIYEGTNGIQAIDLVTRKLPLSGGQTVKDEIASIRESIEALRGSNAPALAEMAAPLGEAADALARATDYMLGALGAAPADALAGAAPYLRLFGIARGGSFLADIARAAHKSGESDPANAARIASARFFARNIAPGARGLELAVTEGASSVNVADAMIGA